MKIKLNLLVDFIPMMGIVSLVIVTQAWPQANPERITKGKQIYSEKRCALCHVMQGKGGKAGPDLSDVGAKRDAQWLGRFMIAPSSVVPKAKMPPFQGSADELDALVAYLRSLDRR
jgi:cbb3-type cytochrome oxidase cytochrome c subunit